LKELQHIAVSMRNSANNLFGLLENLLEWSRMQRGITGFDPRPISLIRLITDSIQSVTGPADKKGIDIVYNIPENLEVFADVNMIGSTIRNLVSNAVKFTFKGGWITIGATPMPDHSVLISVKDSGIGMNKTILHNLFNLDEQTNRKGTDDEPSTGLGLLLCKDFIEKHNGKLWVDSTEGTGSTFCFSLPGNPSIKP
jgi:signal transduction histidine kinase